MSDKPILPDLSESLKSALFQAVRSYEVFKQAEIPQDAKGFTAYHNACKSALTHIALLMKLIQGSSVEAPSSEPDWLSAARLALNEETEETRDLFST